MLFFVQAQKFFLADDGNYSGAVEQIIQELAEEEKRRELWEKLQLSENPGNPDGGTSGRGIFLLSQRG